MIAALAVCCAAALVSAAEGASEERLALVVGADTGAPEDEPLHYAETDARRMRDLLVELGGVHADRALLVTGEGAARVQQAITELRGRAAELSRAGHRVVLFFYYSGHGDEDGLHLRGGELALADLRDELARVPADLRVLVIDACRTGGRLKGLRAGPSFGVAAAPELPHGWVEVRASSAGEASQESERLEGAVFTHFLLAGLRGAADTDGDGRVTLAELYAYAYRRTLMQTGSGAVLQHPSAFVDLRGAGEIVLSHLVPAGSSLEITERADRYLVFSLPDAAVVAELSGDGPSRLALPPGRFLVIRQEGGATSAAQVWLPWGGHQRLEPSSFRAVSPDEVAARGGRLELRDLWTGVRSGVELGLGGTARWAARTGVVVSESRGRLELEGELAFVGAGASTAGLTGAERGVSAAPSVGLRTFLGPATLVTSIGLDLRATWQQLERGDGARLRAANLPSSEVRSFASAGPRAAVRLALPLWAGVSASLAVTATLLGRRETDAPGGSHIAWDPLLGAALGVGATF